MRLATTAFAVVLLFVARLPGQTPAAKQAQDAGARETVEFNRDIRPLLSDKCYTCHGPDQARRRANSASTSKRSQTGPRWTLRHRAGRCREERNDSPDYRHRSAGVCRRVVRPHADNREIDLIQRWIEQGARWEKHWSFIPPRRAALPEVRNRAWPRNEIDFFVLERLEHEGLDAGSGGGSRPR